MTDYEQLFTFNTIQKAVRLGLSDEEVKQYLINERSVVITDEEIQSARSWVKRWEITPEEERREVRKERKNRIERFIKLFILIRKEYGQEAIDKAMKEIDKRS